jgi:hypothetical protein
MPDPASDLDLVLLDLHPPPTPMAELAPREVAIQRVAVQRQPGRDAFEDAREAGAVGLAGGGQSERHGAL